MSGEMVGGIVQGVSNLVSSGLGFTSSMLDRQANKEIAYKNLEFQRENLDWQRHVQQKTWDREDTAIQRRRQDLQSAGMNPYLAMNGNGAASGAIVSTQAPQNQFQSTMARDMAPYLAQLSGTVGQFIDAYKSVQEVKKNQLETKYLELINKGQNQKNFYDYLKNIDFGNQLYHDWAYDNGQTWILPDVAQTGLSPEQNSKWQSTSYKWKNRNYNLDINDLNKKLYQADVLQSETRADFEYSNQLEGLIVDALRTLISGYGVYNNRGRRR